MLALFRFASKASIHESRNVDSLRSCFGTIWPRPPINSSWTRSVHAPQLLRARQNPLLAGWERGRAHSNGSPTGTSRARWRPFAPAVTRAPYPFLRPSSFKSRVGRIARRPLAASRARNSASADFRSPTRRALTVVRFIRGARMCEARAGRHSVNHIMHEVEFRELRRGCNAARAGCKVRRKASECMAWTPFPRRSGVEGTNHGRAGDPARHVWFQNSKRVEYFTDMESASTSDRKPTVRGSSMKRGRAASAASSVSQ